MKKLLTIKSVEALRPREKAYAVFDTKVAGLGVWIGPSGVKSFFLKYVHNRRQRKMTLGRLGEITADEARSRAQAARGDLAKGTDPQGERDAIRAGRSVSEAWEEYFQALKAKRKSRTVEDYGSIYRLHLGPALGTRLLASLSYSDADLLHHRLRAKPFMANRTLAVLSSFYSYCIKRQWVSGTNVCRSVERYEERPRERVLSATEIARLGEALDSEETSVFPVAAIRLILLLGCRRSEVLGMRWDQIDLDAGTIRLQDTKTGARTIHLNAGARAVLKELPRLKDNPHVIPGEKPGKALVNISKPWLRIARKAKIEGARLHDLRRSFATHALNGGISIETVSRLLGHATISQTQRAYAFTSKEALQEAAMSTGDTLSAALAGRHDNVVPLKRSAS